MPWIIIFKTLTISMARFRFVTRSFFVGPVEQSHVDSIMKTMGGPQLKVGFLTSSHVLCDSFNTGRSIVGNP